MQNDINDIKKKINSINNVLNTETNKCINKY